MLEVGFEQATKINALVPKSYSEAQVPHAPLSQSIYDKRLTMLFSSVGEKLGEEINVCAYFAKVMGDLGMLAGRRGDR